MPPTWRPGIPTTLETVRALLDAQCPALLGPDLRQAGTGWDHSIWRCGDVVFRLPHQQSSLDLAARRAALLSPLAERLPLPIPRTLHVGDATDQYPGRFVAYVWMDGTPPAELDLSTADRTAAAAPLASTLAALHRVPVGEARAWGLGAPEDPGSLAIRTANATRRAEQLQPTRWAPLAAAAAARMAEPGPDLTAAMRRPCHGDLHPGQLLFDQQHRLVGILDWDEICIGDPAFDLQLVYSLLPASARQAFWSTYGAHPGDPGLPKRARHIALSTSLALLAQGVAEGDAALEADAGESVGRALADA
jgi:aminoglycoside phosphotransferase (APT) family kinase protein